MDIKYISMDVHKSHYDPAVMNSDEN